MIDYEYDQSHDITTDTYVFFKTAQENLKLNYY